MLELIKPRLDQLVICRVKRLHVPSCPGNLDVLILVFLQERPEIIKSTQLSPRTNLEAVFLEPALGQTSEDFEVFSQSSAPNSFSQLLQIHLQWAVEDVREHKQVNVIKDWPDGIDSGDTGET